MHALGAVSIHSAKTCNKIPLCVTEFSVYKCVCVCLRAIRLPFNKINERAPNEIVNYIIPIFLFRSQVTQNKRITRVYLFCALLLLHRFDEYDDSLVGAFSMSLLCFGDDQV